MHRVEVKPELLFWARQRARMDIDKLISQFPKYREWEVGELKPTMKQLEKFAKFTHVPIGYFFLSKPPNLPFPIPDLRNMSDVAPKNPSLELLDTIYICQRRQFWYQNFARNEGENPAIFVGSASLTTSVETVAKKIRTALRFGLEERRSLSDWTDALRRFVKLTDELGVLVMVSGIVGNDTHRALGPREFRGFALADDYAPLIFINGADTKAGQMFTLAHELAHLWLGQTALSDSWPDANPDHNVEIWCNRVAAELLVPRHVLQEEFRWNEDLATEVKRLARLYKVSSLVILRRIYDLHGLTRDEFRRAHDDELEKLKIMTRSRRGNFYPTLIAGVGERFARAVVTNTLEGETSFTEAFRLLDLKNIQTFDKLAKKLEIVC